MSRARRICVSVMSFAALSVPAAVAASPSAPTSHGSDSAGSSSPHSSATSSNPSRPSGTPTARRISVEKPFDIVLDSKGVAEANKLPTSSSVFTQSELAQVVPGLRAVSVSGDTQTLTIKDDAPSTLQIVLKRFGTKDAIATAWQREKAAHTKRSQANPGLYTFFDGRFGARDAFTDGTNTHVLLNKGDAAGEIWFSGSGFAQLADNYSASRRQYVSKVVPALIQLLADKVAQGVPAASPSKS